MTSPDSTPFQDQDDASLVRASRSGDRDAFGQIVRRYQTLVCSLAYSATGSIGRSEDIAQETFVAAWKQLTALRDPANLRAWLCGIARNLTSNNQRRANREPVHQAELLHAADDLPADDPAPAQQAISREEEAIMWRSLAEIPETYREPMILFYRQQHSVEAVARALDLSEDAVKQRLSRGRLLLQQQVAAFVEGTLERTKPDRAFTTHVMSALPFLTVSGTFAAGGLAAKGSTASKTATAAVLSGTALTAGLLWFLSFTAFVIFLGGCLGYVMSRAAQRSARHRQSVTRFWRTLACGFAVFVLPGWLAVHPTTAAVIGPTIQNLLTYWLGLIHVLVPAAALVWGWQWLRSSTDSPSQTADPQPASRRSFLVWLGLGMAVPAVFFVYFVAQLAWFHPTLTARQIAEPEALRLIAERADATFRLQLHEGNPHTIEIRVPELGRTVLRLRANERVLSTLQQHDRKYEAREFHEAPLPVRWLTLLSCFIAPAGFVILIRRPWRHAVERAEAVASGREKNTARVFMVAAALALLAGAGGLVLVTRWSARVVSEAELRQIVAEHPSADFRVFHYKDGTSTLAITVHKEKKPALFYAAADPSALSLLTERRIPYRKVVQGPDFGFADPSRTFSVLSIAALVTGAVALLWCAARSGSDPRRPAPQ